MSYFVLPSREREELVELFFKLRKKKGAASTRAGRGVDCPSMSQSRSLKCDRRLKSGPDLSSGASSQYRDERQVSHLQSL